MNSTETPTTLRAAIAAQIDLLAVEADKKSHRRNYSKLHVMRDGTVRWGEFINLSDDLIDDRADRFQAIANLCVVGTGSCECNCDYCSDSNYESIEDAIGDAVCDGDRSMMESDMQAELDRIPAGYFADEDEDAA